jgi:hypothetical protein
MSVGGRSLWCASRTQVGNRARSERQRGRISGLFLVDGSGCSGRYRFSPPPPWPPPWPPTYSDFRIGPSRFVIYLNLSIRAAKWAARNSIRRSIGVAITIPTKEGFGKAGSFAVRRDCCKAVGRRLRASSVHCRSDRPELISSQITDQASARLQKRNN